MEPEVPQDPQDAGQQDAVPQEPAAPQYDLDTAYDVIIRAEGWDPRLARLQVQEIKERKESLDRRERELEQQRQQYSNVRPPAPEFNDPYQKELYETKQMVQQLVEDRRAEREEARRERDQQKLIDKIGQELDSSYTTTAMQAGMNKGQIEAESKEFFRTLTQIYPEPDMISRIGADNAVRTAYRVFKAGGTSPRPYSNPMRDPRATFVVPTNGGAQNTASQAAQDAAQRPDETPEQYFARLIQGMKNKGFMAPILPDGTKSSFG